MNSNNYSNKCTLSHTKGQISKVTWIIKSYNLPASGNCYNFKSERNKILTSCARNYQAYYIHQQKSIPKVRQTKIKTPDTAT